MFWPYHRHVNNPACIIQQWLRQPGRTLTQLEVEYAITAKRHKLFPNLVQLKYNQLESDFTSPLVRQCRGIILDEQRDWNIVAWPFDKFGNYGEGYVPEIDWKTARIQEKLDGSLMILYYYNYQWQVATSGTPDASGEVNGYGITFKQLFWDTFHAKGFVVPSVYQEDLTFMFELMTPFNKIVVQHKESDLKLIGVRNRATGAEMNPAVYGMYDPVKQFGHKDSIDELLESFPEIDPCKMEGYVVVDKFYNRLKVKHPGYVKLHHMRDGLTPKGILSVIMAGEHEEVINSFPEWREVFENMKATLDGLAMELDQWWNDIKDIPQRKDFAELAKQSKLPAILFLLLDKKIQNAREGLCTKIHVDKLMEVLQVRKLFERELPQIVGAE